MVFAVNAVELTFLYTFYSPHNLLDFMVFLAQIAFVNYYLQLSVSNPIRFVFFL